MMRSNTVPIAALAVIANAAIWGTSWWPFRWMEARGLHALWSTAFLYALCVLATTLFAPAAWGQFLRRPAILVLALSAGLCNGLFNWSMTVGEVVRALLLFYLMPVWQALLGRLLLGESITLATVFRMGLALVGACLVIGQGNAMLPIPERTTDWLAVLGGVFFALNTTLLKSESQQPAAARALAMFVGCVVVPLALIALWPSKLASGAIPSPIHATPTVWWGVVIMAVLFMAANLLLQYGAARLTGQTTALLLFSEVLFGAVSSVLLTQEKLTAATLAGGACILAAALSAIVTPTPEAVS